MGKGKGKGFEVNVICLPALRCELCIALVAEFMKALKQFRVYVVGMNNFFSQISFVLNRIGHDRV